MEFLTDALMKSAWKHIIEVKTWVEWQKRLKQGLPKMRIEEAAARRQAKIDSEPILL